MQGFNFMRWCWKISAGRCRLEFSLEFLSNKNFNTVVTFSDGERLPLWSPKSRWDEYAEQAPSCAKHCTDISPGLQIRKGTQATSPLREVPRVVGEDAWPSLSDSQIWTERGREIWNWEADHGRELAKVNETRFIPLPHDSWEDSIQILPLKGCMD